MREYLGNLLNAVLIEPWALWLFVLVGLLFGVCLFWRKRPLHVLALRLGLLSLLILALADPAVQHSELSREITALFDVSRSISPAARAKMIDALSPYLGKDTNILLVPFASQPSAESLRLAQHSAPDETKRKLEDSQSKVNPADTNIAAAITRVVQSSRTSSVLLLSDGQETLGDSLQAARIAGSRGLRVFPNNPRSLRF